MVSQLSPDQIRAIISSEVRDQLITSSNTEKLVKRDIDSYPPVKKLPAAQALRILVTGGSGFVGLMKLFQNFHGLKCLRVFSIGSHLVDRLMLAGHHVIVVDNMFTGRQKNVAQWIGHPHFQLIIHDVVEPIMLEVDQIYHLACPASPPHYQVLRLLI